MRLIELLLRYALPEASTPSTVTAYLQQVGDVMICRAGWGELDTRLAGNAHASAGRVPAASAPLLPLDCHWTTSPLQPSVDLCLDPPHVLFGCRPSNVVWGCVVCFLRQQVEGQAWQAAAVPLRAYLCVGRVGAQER